MERKPIVKPSIYDVKDSRLSAVQENKTCSPEDKKILLTEDPWVSIQGEGRFAGEFFSFIRVSYCPLSCGFCDVKKSWSDKGKEGMTVAELTEWAKTRFPTRVCITGGEPFFKFDEEIIHLTRSLHGVGKFVHFETSGICLPQFIEQFVYDMDESLESGSPEYIANTLAVETINSLPDWVCLSPKFRDCVPDDEQFHYIKTLVDRLSIWRRFLAHTDQDGEWKFVINPDNPETDIHQVIHLMLEVSRTSGRSYGDFSGERFTFQPETRKEMYSIPYDKPRSAELYTQYLEDLAKVAKAVGKLAINFYGADVHVLPQLHQLINYR